MSEQKTDPTAIFTRLASSGSETALRSKARIGAGQKLIKEMIESPEKSNLWRDKVSFLINGLRREGKDGLIGSLNYGAIDKESHDVEGSNLDVLSKKAQSSLYSHPSPFIGSIALSGEDGKSGPMGKLNEKLDEVVDTIESFTAKDKNNEAHRSTSSSGPRAREAHSPSSNS